MTEDDSPRSGRPSPGRPSPVGAVLVVAGAALTVISALLLASAIADGGSVPLCAVLLAAGLIALAAGIGLGIRDRRRLGPVPKRDPATAVPVPPVGWWRLGARAEQNRDLPLHQEVLLGVGLVVAGPLLFLALTVVSPETPGKLVFAAFVMTVLGLGLLVHAAIVAIRRRGRHGG